MIFYLASIDEQYGEFECETMFMMCLHPDTNPEETLEEFAKDWYGQGDEIRTNPEGMSSVGLREGMYWNYEMAYGAGRVKPINADTYHDLQQTGMIQLLVDEREGSPEDGQS